MPFPSQDNDGGNIREPALPRALLVYGARKSGTTLVQSMLDGGASLPMVPGELKLKYILRKRSITSRSRTLAHWYIEGGRSIFPVESKPAAGDEETDPFTGLTRGQARQVIDLDKYSDGLAAIPELGDPQLAEIIRKDVHAFMGAMKVDCRAARFWGSKEAGSNPTGTLNLFRECFPDGMVVLVLREPEFIVRSIILNNSRCGRRLGMRRILNEFRDAQRVLNEGYRETLEESVVTVTYEELTENPEGESRLLCQRLGIPFDEIFAKPTTLGEEVVVSTSSRQTTEVFRQVKDWRKGLSRRQVLMLRMCRIFGPAVYRLRGKRMVSYSTLRQLLATQAVARTLANGTSNSPENFPASRSSCNTQGNACSSAL